MPVIEIPESLLTDTSKQLIQSVPCSPWAHIRITVSREHAASAGDFPIESIEHAEEPAYRDEQLLSLHSDHDFASLVDMQMHSAQSRCSSEETSVVPEKVHLLRFRGGDGTSFRKSLLDGPQFWPCRDDMERQGFPCELPSQALVFVKGEQCAEVMEAIVDYDLHPFHIIIAEHLEYLLDEVLQDIPSRRRPREKKSSLSTVEVPWKVI